MTTAVFSIAPSLHDKPAFVGQIDGFNPSAVCDMLSEAGVLAVETENNSVVIAGFNHEISALVSDFAKQDDLRHDHSKVLAKLARIASAV